MTPTTHTVEWPVAPIRAALTLEETQLLETAHQMTTHLYEDEFLELSRTTRISESRQQGRSKTGRAVENWLHAISSSP